MLPFAKPNFTTVCSDRLGKYASQEENSVIRRAFLVTTVGLLTVLGTSACNMLSPVATHNIYAPSDGTQGDLGFVKARNIIYFTDGKGHGALYGAFANSSNVGQDFAIKLEGGTRGAIYRQFHVDAYKVLNFGFQNKAALKVDLRGKAGDITRVLLYSETGSVSLNVPILDGTFPLYADIVNSLGN